MKQRTYKLSLLLAALLQLMPMARSFLANPAVTSSFAIVFRWVVGGTAALGAFDAVSGATTVYFSSPTNFTGTAGSYFTNNVRLANNGGDSGAFFVLTNKSGISAALTKNTTTTTCLPGGLTAKCYDLNTGGSPQPIYLAIYGTPTSPVTNHWIHILAGFKSETPAQTNIFITILPAVSASPPNITNQPLSVTNLVGSNVTFSVTAGGTEPLFYQWYFNTNKGLADATNASFPLTNIQTTNSGFYSVIITNSAGSITSTPARLFVAEIPNITNQPAGATNLAGSDTLFSVWAGGTPPLHYQWYLNAVTALGGETNASLALPKVRVFQAGDYSVIVTNNWGTITSAPARLEVIIPASPALVSAVVVAGNQFQFTFNPIAGLTNTVITNTTLTGGTWLPLTNIPPPVNTNPITITDPISGPNKFYRVLLNP